MTINNENSSDVWSAFRVGKRAKVSKKTFKEVDNYLSASGQHDGYSYMPGKPIHSRSWELAPNSLQITDSVFSSNKNHKKIIIRYFLHPDFSAVVKNNQEGIIEGGEVIIKWHSSHKKHGLRNLTGFLNLINLLKIHVFVSN